MMIAKQPSKLSIALRMATVAVATCVALQGFVSAQDFEAVERRLGGAVEAGELTLEQAKLMMDALRGSKKSSNAMELKKRRYMEFVRELEGAVKAGKLSKEDAQKKLIAVRKEMFGGGEDKKAKSNKKAEQDEAAKKRKYMAIYRELEAAIKAGKLSKEDAEKKLIAVRKEMFGDGGEKKVKSNKKAEQDEAAKKRKYMAILRELEEAVKAGKLSKEDAEKELIGLRKEMFGGGDDKKAQSNKKAEQDEAAKKRKYMAILRELEEAVKAGKISKEDAEKKLIGLRKEMFGGADQKAKGDKKAEQDEAAKKRQYMAIARELEAAVKAGKLSKEDAEKKLIAVRNKMFGSKEKK